MGCDWTSSGGKETTNPQKKNSVSRSEKVRILTSLDDQKLTACFSSCTEHLFCLFLWYECSCVVFLSWLSFV